MSNVVPVRNSRALPDNLAVYTSDWARRHASHSSVLQITSCVADTLAPFKPRTVLDIGCGSGRLVDTLVRRGYFATGLDVVSSNIDFAIRRFCGEFVVGDVESMIRIGRVFDAVVLSHVLEHFDDPVSYLKSIRRLLDRRGHLIILVPNLDSFDPASLWRSSRVYTLFDSNHKIVFSPQTLCQVVLSAGYSISSLTTRTYRSNIYAGLLSGICRRLFTRRSPSSGDASLVSPAVGDSVERICSHLPSGWFDRISENGLRGADIVVVAEVA